MSSRPWEDSYFPPPGYPPLRDRLPSHPQNQPQNAPSPRNSSSSSSNDAPSEPMIDLSSWSPRSHHTMNAWELKTANGPPHFESRPDWPIFTSSNRISTPIDVQQTCSIFATENHAPKSRTHWILSLMRFDVLPTPRPLNINPFSFLRAISELCHTLRVPTKSNLTATIEGHYTIAILGRQLHQKCDTLTALLISTSYDLQLMPPHPPTQSDQYGSSQRPNESPHVFPHESPVISKKPELNKHTLDLQNQNLHSLPATHLTDTVAEHSIVHQWPLGPPGFQHTQFEFDPTEQNPQQHHDPLQKHDSPQQHDSPQKQQTLLSQSSPHQFSIPTVPASLPTKTQKKAAPRKFLKPMATRKSQRLLTKQKLSSPVPKLPPKNATKRTQLPFDKDSYETPLDTPTVLAILQATGLQINEQVQQMVNQATQTDTSTDPGQHSRPLTPLHDSTPPRIVPGIDLPL